MRLNVYLISHPIIQKLSAPIRYTIDDNSSIEYNYNTFQQLHILLIYEVLRKWIKSFNVYIQYTDFIKELYVFDSKESYIIMTNLMNCGNILPYINYLLPQVYIQHINLNHKIPVSINDNYLDSEIVKIIKQNKIIIMDNFLTNSIVQLLDYLVMQKEVKVKEIRIICIICTNQVLEKIADQYPLVSIYTTKIYKN